MKQEFLDKLEKLNTVYSPTQPIKTQELFFGRVEQLEKINEAVKEKGQHIVLYGDRGVGKTSLANIVKFQYLHAACCSVTCNQGSSLFGLWKLAFRRIPLAVEHFKQIGFNPDKKQSQAIKNVTTLADHFDSKKNVNVDTINEFLEKANGLGFKIIFIFDEFDQIEDESLHQDFSNIVKFCSDHLENVTTLIVGIGKSVNDLISNHQSIERSIKQVHLQHMSDSELSEIIDKANNELGLTIIGSVKQKIISYSSGYPHYTHLLGKYATKHALQRQSNSIKNEDLNFAVDEAIKNASESIRKLYEKAIITTKKQSYFPAVLTACALVSTDQHGTFGLSDIQKVLKRELGLDIGTQGYQYHIGKLASDDRGNVLERISTGSVSRYKFSNPLFRTFVVLKHLQNN